MARPGGDPSTPEEDAVKYLCLIYIDETTLDALPKAEMDALIDESLDYDEVLRQGGHYVASNALQSAQTATTVRVRGGKVSTTDGPFAETKEQLGGFILLEARDLNEAIRVASRVPGARLGSLELRPVKELKHS
jgi:hypothetical protein